MSSLGQHFSQIKLKKRQKNKPYKAFNRYRTDLSLVGLYILLYMLFILDRLQRGVFHHFLKFLYCHSSIFRRSSFIATPNSSSRIFFFSVAALDEESNTSINFTIPV